MLVQWKQTYWKKLHDSPPPSGDIQAPVYSKGQKNKRKEAEKLGNSDLEISKFNLMLSVWNSCSNKEAIKGAVAKQ